jgi:hypothetical protein
MTHTATLRRNFPTLWWLATAPFHWLGRSRRRIWGLVAMLLAMIAGPPLWWAVQLAGLPDIGEPFDVQAFRSATLPDDQNAFVLYRQAAALLKPLRESEADTAKARRVVALLGWSKAAPEVRRWVEANREALALYRQASERPDALDHLPDSFHPTRYWHLRSSLNFIQEMALLEASRREEHGDGAGAWEWYRAVLRTIHHIRRRGTLVARLGARHWHTELRKQVTSWAKDSRTTPALLRRALADVVACEAMTPSESYTLKAEYLNAEELLTGRYNRGNQAPPPWLRSLESMRAIQSLGIVLSPEQMQSLLAAWRSWRREPERSRRVLRLVTANWLAYYDLPPDQRPSADPNVSSWDLYPWGLSAPAQARALSPEALALWLETAHDVQAILRLFNWRGIRIQELTGDRDLVIRLASELYRRDRGSDPPTPEALVGPYLQRLPPELPEGE